MKTLPVVEGMEITIDVLDWFEPAWEFDNPVVIIRPVYREYETSSVEHAIEDVLLDACSDEVLRGWDGPHRWNIRTLRERFRAARGGAAFPVKQFQAHRQRVRVTRDADGLTWEDITDE